MKKITFFLISVVLLLTACEQPQLTIPSISVDFENVDIIDSLGYLHNESFKAKGIEFANDYNAEWQSWQGFACSTKTDITTPGYENQYSVIAGKAASGKKFALAYNSATLSFSKGVYGLESVLLCNTTYSYLALTEGSDYNKKFAEGDWFKVIFTGMDADGKTTGTVEYYLADFRDGKSVIVKDWTMVDLSGLGVCKSVNITFDSTDKGEYGINNPTYVALDNLVYRAPKVDVDLDLN